MFVDEPMRSFRRVRRTRRRRSRRVRQKGGFLNVLAPALAGLGKAVALETDKRIKSYMNKAKQRHRRRGRW